jgi:SET domain-containing protein
MAKNRKSADRDGGGGGARELKRKSDFSMMESSRESVLLSNAASNEEQLEMKNAYLACSAIAGMGVFAARRFQAGEWIMSFMEGVSEVVPYSVTINNPEHAESHYVQIGSDLYVHPTPPSLYLNHSCDPNTGVRDATEIIALIEIEADTELTFDYSTSMAEDGWEMDCACGAANCRQRIRDFKHLPVERQIYYIKRGVVGDFCIESIRELIINR